MRIDGLSTPNNYMTRFFRFPSLSSRIPLLFGMCGVFLSGCGSEVRLESPREVVDTANDLILSYKIKDARKLLLNHEDLFPDSEPLTPISNMCCL